MVRDHRLLKTRDLIRACPCDTWPFIGLSAVFTPKIPSKGLDIIHRSIGYGPWPDHPPTRNERAETVSFTDAIRLGLGRQGWLPLALRPSSRPGLWGFISFAGRPGAGHYPPRKQSAHTRAQRGNSAERGTSGPPHWE